MCVYCHYGFFNLLDNFFPMVEDFFISESDDCITPLLKVTSPFLILYNLFIIKMILTINFNNKFILKVDEVGNVLFDDMLSTKLISTLFSF
jgi:hypothetical protein